MAAAVDVADDGVVDVVVDVLEFPGSLPNNDVALNPSTFVVKHIRAN